MEQTDKPEGLSRYIKRELYIRKIRPFMNREIIKILTGIRRCGKSVLLKLIQEELLEQGVARNRIIAMNFDTFENAGGGGRTAESLYGEIKNRAKTAGGRVYLFLDEIQELEGWERLVNSCLTELGADIYLSGSNAKMLSGEYSSALSGRYVLFRIYPFSFDEAARALTGAGNALSPAEMFDRYLLYGGMPFVYQLPLDDAAIKQYLGDIADAIILKDISARYRVRDIGELKRLILFLFANTGCPFSAQSVQNYLKNEKRKLSWETINNYIEYCKTAFLLLPTPREDLSGKRLLKTNGKIYFTDHGIREALYGHNKRDIQQILENIVYLELLRRDYAVTVGKIGDREIDFIAKKNNKTIYLQVCYLLASPETADREFSALAMIKDNFPKYVLSLDEFDLSRDGIQHFHIRNFLGFTIPGV
ncbi:MAG: ATP-binding protein [Treponema sp.]|jgi:predicted AAA+ superfamily ATPase|nr:ATP-binding protein [Treponema sp.]